ncbi:MAG: isoleucine--tRNA ligase [Flavobacteriales bacterium]|nr:MAG: isoleucine--tRNA ligase [Flavobacteriales bacterium]
MKSSKFREYKQLDLPKIGREILDWWEENNTFQQSVDVREGEKSFVFYEGPPSANGMPGIHHVMARTIKDIFCRYKTQKGFQVKRKAGWDTHGLPVELAVEKELGITKEDIGTKISIEEYNQKCREAVMKYTAEWEDLTKKMGYWVDMDDPYVTYDNNYIESVWWLLKSLYNKGLLYKGYSVQPYSPAAGTGLSTHELNLPGCYKDVKDQTCIAQFELQNEDRKRFLNILKETADPATMENWFAFDHYSGNWKKHKLYLLAWTTTPWTLPSNTALAVGSKIDYIAVETFNVYTGIPCIVVIAKDLLPRYFEVTKEGALGVHTIGKQITTSEEDEFRLFEEGLTDELKEEILGKGKIRTWRIIAQFKGKELIGYRYKQLLPYMLPMDNPENAFQVISGDFVTTEDGTGIVHIAPTFGADDMFVAKKAGVPPMLVPDDEGNPVPLVDTQGRFIEQMGELAHKYVKNEYYNDGEAPEKSVDVEIVIKLKQENKCFHAKKYDHNYPHCWRTDKPILYYPLDSWFIKTTACKERMIELNNTINWKPEHTGTGRFGEWLNNLQDWNLSRSRYWGIPLPIWRTKDGSEEICIGSAEELQKEIEKAVAAGLMKNHRPDIELHRPYVDDVVLVSDSGKPMHREIDLIDVWFDSGAMPYAQLHYPFENKELIDEKKFYPADYIAEGVDQTRGWFFTLHAIAAMCFDSVAYKNVISNGLVLDKAGQKMSKRLGNAADPFETLEKYGPDATRWYMITNAQPWDNLKFDIEGISEVQRKFFRAVHNTYAFFSLYANIDEFSYKEAEVPIEKRPEIDRWIISKLNSLIKETTTHYEDFEPTKAGRAIEEFALGHLSNWYVRLSRRRFWKGEYSEDKIAAYQTLYHCLEAISQLSAPISPFFSEKLFKDLNAVSQKQEVDSVHIALFPEFDEKAIDRNLEEKMEIAQKISSLALALRKKEQIRVRQPLQKIMVPVLDKKFSEQIENVQDLILSEVNVKEMELLTDTSGIITKKIKPNFKTLGPKYGKMMKEIAGAVNQFSQEDIVKIESKGSLTLNLNGSGTTVDLTLKDVEITSEDIPGWLVASEGKYTVALDITITDKLREEGIAREFVNRIQNIRKDKGFEVTDKIKLKIQSHKAINDAINNNLTYICSETLATSLELVEKVKPEVGFSVELENNVETLISIDKN